MSDFSKYLILVVFFILLGIGFSYLTGKIFSCGNITQPKSGIAETIVIRDSVRNVIPSENLKLTAKPVIKILRDTVIQCRPFIAKIDTVIRHDTIRSAYEYPANLFSLQVNRKPDTILTERTILMPSPAEKDAWWNKPAILAGGIVLGIIIKSLK